MKNRLLLAASAVLAGAGLCAATAPAAAAARAPLAIGVACGDAAGLVTAVNRANARTEGATITLAENCAYRFEDDYGNSGTALPAVTGRVSLIGEHTTLIRSVRGGVPRFRILAVNERGRLTLKGVTVTGGHTDGDGGGIANEGTLWMENGKVTGNRAGGDGGGISNEGGEVTLVHSEVLTNAVTTTAASAPSESGNGGGLDNGATGLLTLRKSIVAGNTADGDGGGVRNRGTLIVESSHFTQNEARDAGGGIGNLGSARIENSRFQENRAGLDGGAVDNGGIATLEVHGTAFVDNKAGRDGGAIGNEGAALVKDSEVEGNQAGRDGGGIHNEQEEGSAPTRLTLDHTSVSDNRAARTGGGTHNSATAELLLTESDIRGNLPVNCAGTVSGCS
ncbi:hypothetical protein [Streptomyces sp. SPB4]|uniref:hypothetical protein n=1 Tax=Streptomyces sp. SPB4 TaxID=2940553 RepID=UPI00247716A0|nr:hypothetical protein [Streptomyces sp. SPB4]